MSGTGFIYLAVFDVAPITGGSITVSSKGGFEVTPNGSCLSILADDESAFVLLENSSGYKYLA